MAGQDGGYGLGVDLGTSHTVAVLRWPDGRTRPLLHDGQPILPSGVFLDDAGRPHVGRDAQRLAQADPARYEPNPKRRIDEPAVLLGDREIATVDLLAGVLGAVANAAVEAVGFLPPAVLSYPASWGSRRRDTLAAAVARAGWPPVPSGADPAARLPGAGPAARPNGGTLLVPEPVAAARYFTDVLRRPVPVRSALAVFDFGGGTLDIAVVRNEGIDGNGRARFVVVGSGGVADLGGLDLDAALVEHLGGVIRTAYPPIWEQLRQPASAGQWRARRQFWDDVRGAKEMLSRTATAPVAVPGVEQALHLTRDELESVVGPLLRRGVHEAASVIARSGLAVDQLAGLFLVGGSSRVPLVARMLHAELGIAPTVLEQPELPVAEGALAELPLPATLPARGSAGVPTSPAAGGAVPTSPAAAAGGAVPGQPRAYETGAAPVPGASGPATAVAGASGAAAAGGYPPTGPAHPAGGVGPAHPAGGVGSAWLAGLARRRPVWIGVGALVALVGVVAATLLYLTRDRYPGLDYVPFQEVDRIATREKNRTSLLTATAGERAYVAYQRTDQRLDIAVLHAESAKVERWITTAAGAEGWRWIKALPDVLLAKAEVSSTSTPRDLIALDPVTGAQLWKRAVRGDDRFYFFDEYVVVLDETADMLIGINARTGKEWTRPNPKGEYDSDAAGYPMRTLQEVSGPAEPYGDAALPNRGAKPRLVQIGADGSIRVIDVTNGEVLKSRADAADTDDEVLAYEGQLFVAPKTGGYGLARYDLETLGPPTTIYNAADKNRRPTELEPCGEKQVCLLETAGSGTDSTELVAVRTDQGGSQQAAWRRKVPQAKSLLAVGERVLVQTGSSGDPVAKLFSTEGAEKLSEDGVAVRVDGGNLLLFAKELSTITQDASVAGVVAESGKLTQLGLLKEVSTDSCSWNTSVIVCGADSEFVVARFTAG
ncbi:Hsp70 family protein [Plantactinospora sp. B6F1]|uniref:Hsp70 family protein n=1 Tax=Plantactinospora sp. B6F1 TaxID=3158971 RepID=UPI0032D97F63